METGELTEQPETEPDTEPTPEPEPEPEPEGRCEAETTVGGTEFRCALQALHEGEHAFTAIDAEHPEPVTTAAVDRKALEKLANEAMRHRKRLEEIMGDDANLLVPCVL